MASSGVVTYTVNENDIITDAAQTIGVLGAGETMPAEDQTLFRRKLNLIVKQWSSPSDFSPGMKMWARKRGFLFLQKDQSVYSLGPSGDHAAADSYVTTTVGGTEASGQTVITVASSTGITNGMNIGIELSTGALHWTTVSGAPSGNDVTIAVALTASSAANGRVFSYSTKIRRPLEILTAKLVTTDNVESPIDTNWTLQEYEATTNRTTEGTPSGGYFEAQLTNAKLYLDREPDDVTKVVRMVFLSPIEDFTASSDTADFAQEWFRPLVYQLAMDAAPSFGRKISPGLKMLRDESLAIAQRAYPQTTVAYFEPYADGRA